MKSVKRILGLIVAEIVLLPAMAAAATTLESCPCYDIADNYGIGAAIDGINQNVTVLNWTNQRKPPETESKLEIVEEVFPYPVETEQHIWVTVEYDTDDNSGFCLVVIADHYTDNTFEYRNDCYDSTCNEDIVSDTEFRSCLAGVRLLRATAQEYYEIGGN